LTKEVGLLYMIVPEMSTTALYMNRNHYNRPERNLNIIYYTVCGSITFYKAKKIICGTQDIQMI